MTEQPCPRPALLLGPAGLLPFVFTAGAAILGPPEWHALALRALLAYGATILAFLGAVHWGLALSERRAEWPRFGLGVLPALVAWVALLLPAGAGLVLLAAGLVGTAGAETVAAGRGLLPRGYLRLRWGLSLGAAACLLAGCWAA